jgi:hypothetical protein
MAQLRGFDFQYVGLNPPVTALEDDVGVGSCWAFAGSVGYLGIINLAEPAYITDISIYRVSESNTTRMYHPVGMGSPETTERSLAYAQNGVV